MKYLFTLLLTIVSLNTTASNLSAAQEKTILSITGTAADTQKQQTIHFNLSQLQSLPSNTFTMQTRWDDHIHQYHGPLLTALLEHVKFTGKTIELTALNNYVIEIDRSFIEKYQPILAWQKDSKKMSIRRKGPLWLLLPHHLHSELNTEEHTGKMIWQLRHIEIK